LRSDWGIQDTLVRAGLDGHHREFHQSLSDFWKSNFFSNECLEYDLPYEGAVEYVQALHQAGAEIVYLTGRDIPRMGVGSPKVIKKWHFPLDEKSARLVLKPEKSMDDAQFKSDYFKNLPKNTYEKIWLFENEPTNIRLVRLDHRHVEVVFIDSTHSGDHPKPLDLPTILHYILD
jgi:hypothetical protein